MKHLRRPLRSTVFRRLARIAPALLLTCLGSFSTRGQPAAGAEEAGTGPARTGPARKGPDGQVPISATGGDEDGAGQDAAGHEAASEDPIRSPAIPGVTTTALEDLDRRAGSPVISGRVLTARRIRGFSTELAARLLGGEIGGELPAEISTAVIPGHQEQATVSFAVEVDGVELVQASQEKASRVELYAYATTPQGAVAGYLAEAVGMDLDDLGAALGQSGLKFQRSFELPPGAYHLRVLVRDPHTGRDALRIVPFVVPESRTRELVGLLPEPTNRDAWLTVRSPGGATHGGLGYAFDGSGHPIRPAARPLLVAGRGADAWLLALDPVRDEIDVSIQFLAPEADSDKILAKAEATARLVPRPAETQLGAFALRFRMPETRPGAYRLRFVSDDAGGQARTSPPIRVVVLGKKTLERELLWTDLRWLVSESPQEASDGELRSEASGRAGPRAGGSRRKLQQRYRQVLAALAQGTMGNAPLSLFEMESAALAGGRRDSLANLWDAERGVADSLVAADAESLVPLLDLHARLYVEYQSRRLFSLVSHSRRMVSDLADSYVLAGGSPTVAAQALIVIGGYLQRSTLHATSVKFFQRALVLDPENETALLSLATISERLGSYEAAAGFLEELLLHRPDHGEGILRLAVNLGRLGQQKRSEELLGSLVSRSVPGWVRSLACELEARRLLLAELPHDAAALLEACVESLPEGQQPTLLLAYLYDRMNLPAEAQAPLDRSAAVRRNARASPRLTYDSGPVAAIGRVQEALESSARQRHPQLALALGGDSSGQS